MSTYGLVSKAVSINALNRCDRKLSTKQSEKVGPHQGDQIRRILAYWSIGYFEQGFFNYKRSLILSCFFRGKKLHNKFDEKWLGATFWAISPANSSGHPGTSESAEECGRNKFRVDETISPQTTNFLLQNKQNHFFCKH
jgi:hypothetical protein